jgi:hypothetical protein
MIQYVKPVTQDVTLATGAQRINASPAMTPNTGFSITLITHVNAKITTGKVELMIFVPFVTEHVMLAQQAVQLARVVWEEITELNQGIHVYVMQSTMI